MQFQLLEILFKEKTHFFVYSLCYLYILCSEITKVYLDYLETNLFPDSHFHQFV